MPPPVSSLLLTAVCALSLSLRLRSVPRLISPASHFALCSQTARLRPQPSAHAHQLLLWQSESPVLLFPALQQVLPPPSPALPLLRCVLPQAVLPWHSFRPQPAASSLLTFQSAGSGNLTATPYLTDYFPVPHSALSALLTLLPLQSVLLSLPLQIPDGSPRPRYCSHPQFLPESFSQTLVSPVCAFWWQSPSFFLDLIPKGS